MKILRYWYLMVLFLFVAGRGPVRAQTFAWAKQARTDVDTTYTSRTSATDASGNTYVYTQYSDNLFVGTSTVTGTRYQWSAMIKYDSTGTVRWVKNLHNIIITQLAADNVSGGVFIVAAQNGVGGSGGTWDGMALRAGLSTAFYAKCSDAGALQWTQPLPSIYAFSTGDMNIVSDDSGSAYLLAIPTANGTVGNTAVNANQTFICKIDGAGSVQWVQVMHSLSSPYINRFELGQKPGGGCLVSGQFQNTLYLGPGTSTPLLTVTQNNSTFISSFDATGAYQWGRLLGTPNSPQQSYAYINATIADANGNCYATGRATGSFQIGNTVIPGGFFLVKYDASGTFLWARGQQAWNSSTPYDGGLLLAATTQGVTVMIHARYPNTIPLTVGTLQLPSFFNFVHYTASGVAQWAVSDNPRDLTGAFPIFPYFEPSTLGLDAKGNIYAVGTTPQQYRYAVNPLPVVQFGTQTIVGKGTIVARINAYANTLRGQVYFDQNANGQRDTGEGVFPAQLTGVLTQGGTTIYSPVGTDGVLQAYALPGAYTLGLAQLPRYHNLSQPVSGSYTGTFSGSSQLVSGQDFGIQTTPNQSDVRVTLTSYGVARPGFTTRYRVTVENVGTATSSGTATVTLDSRATYVSNTPSGSRTGQAVTWTYSALAPQARLDYDVLFSLPTNTAVGTVLLTTAAAPLAGDLEPADNAASLTQTVVNSYDPNSIEVNYERLTPTQVAAQQPLDYTIHFQNLGTAYAQNVILSDTLDFRKLNPATLMLVSQSHSCIWSLSSTGPNTGLLVVRFLGINLPERNADVIRSQGFVRFRVQPRPTLAVGEIIPNHAGIVFDYNAAVITNVATTTVFLATAALTRHDAPAWTAYPNPATDVLTLSADLPTAGPLRVELLDVLGRPVRQQTLTAPAGPLRQTVDLRGLARGVYVLRLTPPTGPASSQRVVRE